MKQKPEKIIYENQEEVYNQILIFVKSILPVEVINAYLWGSAVEREFGEYKEKFGHHEGSDIDVIVIIPNKKIPSSWKSLNTQKDWWYLYRGGKIEINKKIHRVDLMIVKDGMEEYARNRIKENNWNVEKIK